MTESNRTEYKRELTDSIERDVAGEKSEKTSSVKGGVIGGAIDLIERQSEIVRLILNDPKISYRKIATTVGINESAVTKHIKTLKEKGVLKRIDGTRGHWDVPNSGHLPDKHKPSTHN